MKKNVQKLILKLLNFVNKTQSNDQKVILCYHSIDESDWEFSTKEIEFERQLAYLKDNYKIVSLDEIIKSVSKKRQVAITFDDGYTTFANNALPLIKKHNVPVTLFALGNSGKRTFEGSNPSFATLSLADLKKISSDNIVVGYHSENHKDLSKIDKKELVKEITISKRTFEKKLGSTIRYFAYPFGKYNNAVLDVVSKSGYAAAFTTKSALYTNNSLYEIPRYCIGNDVSIEEFKTLLTPAGLTYSRILFFLYNIKRVI